MRKITYSGSQYLRYSAFTPDKSRPAIRPLRASHHALRSDVDFVKCQKGGVRLDQSAIDCNLPASPWLLVPAVISSASSMRARRVRPSLECRAAVPPEHGTEKMAERLTELSHLGWQLVVQASHTRDNTEERPWISLSAGSGCRRTVVMAH